MVAQFRIKATNIGNNLTKRMKITNKSNSNVIKVNDVRKLYDMKKKLCKK
jgi:hypothetical protein